MEKLPQEKIDPSSGTPVVPSHVLVVVLAQFMGFLRQTLVIRNMFVKPFFMMLNVICDDIQFSSHAGNLRSDLLEFNGQSFARTSIHPLPKL